MYVKDLEIVNEVVDAVFENEKDKKGFELAHRRDRKFLDNIAESISWLVKSGKNKNHRRKISPNDNFVLTESIPGLLNSLSVYGEKLIRTMDDTFTNPFEIVKVMIINQQSMSF